MQQSEAGPSVDLSDAGSLPAQPPPVAHPEVGEYGPNEVNTADDLYITKEIILGPDDVPPEDDDDGESVDIDDDASL